MTVCLLRGPLSVKGRKRQFFRFLIDVAGKRRKSKEVFDITGRLLSETAVKGNGNDWCRLVTHNRCKRVKGTGTPVYRRSLIVCTYSLVFRCALPKAFALLGYNTHPKLRLHKQPCINVSFSIFCSLDLQSLQTWLSVAAMIKKPSLQKLTTKPVSFSLKHFTMHFSFSAYCPM